VAAAEVDLGSEQLGTYLHELTTVEDRRELPGLGRGLARLLREPGPERLSVLRTFLTAGGDGQGRQRVQDYLRRQGAGHLVAASGALDVEWARREFPEFFFDFVATLDLDAQEDRETLHGLCRALGPERIEGGEKLLGRDPRLRQEPFVRCVFASTSRVLLPFARLIASLGGEGYKVRLADHLREAASLELDRELIDVVRRGEWLSSEYLSLVAKGEACERLTYQRQAILCRFLRETDGDGDCLERRIRAVRLLASFPSVAVMRVLERLLKERRLLFRHAAPPELRAAARDTLLAFERPQPEPDDV